MGIFYTRVYCSASTTRSSAHPVIFAFLKLIGLHGYLSSSQYLPPSSYPSDLMGACFRHSVAHQCSLLYTHLSSWPAAFLTPISLNGYLLSYLPFFAASSHPSTSARTILNPLSRAPPPPLPSFRHVSCPFHVSFSRPCFFDVVSIHRISYHE